MKRALLLALGLWQVVMLWAVANTPAPLFQLCLLALAHIALLLLALVSRRGWFPAGTLIVLVYVVVSCDWAVADSIDGVLCFAGLWLTNLAAAVPTFAMRGRRAIMLPVVAAFVVPIALYAINPEWGTTLPSAIGVTTLAIMIATRLGVPFLIAFARRADLEAALAEHQELKVATLRTASRESAEDARILHDTVINTLGAIANGGAGIADLDAVRERCSRDAATAEELQAANAERHQGDTNLGDIFQTTDSRVRRSGLDDRELLEIERKLPSRVVVMMVRAVKEVLQNTQKHARAEQVALDVQIKAGELVVTITDNGIGFDGRVPPDRGFATSVLSRAAEVGVRVGLDTSPGRGTTVTLTKPLDDPADLGPGLEAETRSTADGIVATLRMRAGWLFAPGVVGVGLVIEFVNRYGQLTEAYWMLALVGFVTAFAWMTRNRDGGFSTSTAIALAVGASVAFVLSAAAVDFGRTDVVFWQAIGPAAPLIVLLASAPRRAVLRAALALFTATVLGCTIIVWRDSAVAASIIPVAGIATLGIVAMWGGFQHAIATIGAQSVDDHHAAARSRLDVAVRMAAEDASRRWRVAGLEKSVELLRNLAHGHADPAVISVRLACAREEAYLRQLTQLSPDLVRLGHWFVQALHDGREGNRTLVLRSGEVDAPDEETAARLGATLLKAVASMPLGGMLSATVFPSTNDLRMTLVSPHPHLAHAHAAWSPRDGTTLTYQTIENQDLIEIIVHGGALT